MISKNLIIPSLIASLAAASVLASPPAQSETARNVWDGVATKQSTERGEVAYQQSCAVCHGAEKRGGSGVPTLAGPEFRFNWNGRTLLDLFDFIKTTMPPGQANTLTEQQYLDLLSALLSANGFPYSPSEGELDIEDLRDVQFLANRPSN